MNLTNLIGLVQSKPIDTDLSLVEIIRLCANKANISAKPLDEKNWYYVLGIESVDDADLFVANLATHFDISIVALCYMEYNAMLHLNKLPITGGIKTKNLDMVFISMKLKNSKINQRVNLKLGGWNNRQESEKLYYALQNYKELRRKTFIEDKSKAVTNFIKDCQDLVNPK